MDPSTRVAVREAMATCAFDWRQSLQDRVDATARYATADYAKRLRSVTQGDKANWASTQRDRETGRCSTDRVFVVSSAPNTAEQKFVRVVLTQTVDTPRTASAAGPFIVTYRVQRQRARVWLVATEINGGS